MKRANRIYYTYTIIQLLAPPIPLIVWFLNNEEIGQMDSNLMGMEDIVPRDILYRLCGQQVVLLVLAKGTERRTDDDNYAREDECTTVKGITFNDLADDMLMVIFDCDNDLGMTRAGNRDDVENLVIRARGKIKT